MKRRRNNQSQQSIDTIKMKSESANPGRLQLFCFGVFSFVEKCSTCATFGILLVRAGLEVHGKKW